MDHHTTTRTADLITAALWSIIATLAGHFRQALRRDRHIRMTEALSPHLQHDAGHLDRDPRIDTGHSSHRAGRDALAMDLLRLP